MRTDIFTLCEGAFNKDGSLTLVNIFDNIDAKKLPWRTTVGLALKLSVSSEDAGDKKMVIQFKDDNGSEILPNIPINLKIDNKEESHLVIAVNLQNIVFANAGHYTVVILIDGVVYDTLSFNVVCHDR